MIKGILSFFLCMTAALMLAGSVNAQGIEIGATLTDFSLADTAGTTRSFESLKGENGTVIVFLSAQCPVVKQYNERLNAIADEYKAKGIAFVGLYPNVTESLEWVKDESTKAGYKFPLLMDAGHVIADRLGATVTPEMYFFDAKNVLIYHGAIDNDKYGKNITDNYLRDAFTAKLAGQKIGRPTAQATGCTIKRKKAE